MQDFNVITDAEMDRLNGLFETALDQLIRYEALLNLTIAYMRVKNMSEIADIIEENHKQILDEQAKLF